MWVRWLGSEGIVTDPARMESALPALGYDSSKTAVIMLTVQYAKALANIKVNIVEPGGWLPLAPTARQVRSPTATA